MFRLFGWATHKKANGKYGGIENEARLRYCKKGVLPVEPERITSVDQPIWGYVGDEDNYEEAKDRGKRQLLSYIEGDSLFIAYGNGEDYKSQRSCLTWKFAWELEE